MATKTFNAPVFIYCKRTIKHNSISWAAFLHNPHFIHFDCIINGFACTLPVTHFLRKEGIFIFIVIGGFKLSKERLESAIIS